MSESEKKSIEQLEARLREVRAEADFNEAIGEGLLRPLPENTPRSFTDVLLLGLAFVSAKVVLDLRGDLSRDPSQAIEFSQFHVDNVSERLPGVLASALGYSPSQVEEASQQIRRLARRYQEHFESSI